MTTGHCWTSLRTKSRPAKALWMQRARATIHLTTMRTDRASPPPHPRRDRPGDPRPGGVPVVLAAPCGEGGATLRAAGADAGEGAGGAWGEAAGGELESRIVTWNRANTE